jgi:hypothetical protein
MTAAIQAVIDGTADRLVAGAMSVPLFFLFAAIAIGTLWYFGERR